jgi:hypothetical protein
MPEPPVAYRVLERRHETHDTRTLRLAPVGDGPARAAFDIGTGAVASDWFCKDGPVLRRDAVDSLMRMAEL